MLSCYFRGGVAVVLAVTMILMTMPVSAADLSTPRVVLASVSTVGPVEVRGFPINQESTLFAGDSIRAREKGYAKILLKNGSKLELAEKTEITVNSDTQAVKIAMNAGTVGFTAASPLRFALQPFEVAAADGAAGNVSIMSPTSAGVRSIKGKVTVRNLKTSESFVLTQGQERLFGLRDGSNHAPLADLASNVPMPVPAPRPQAPAGQTGGGLAMDTGGWIAVIAGGAVAGLAIAGLVIALNNRDDLDDIKAQNTALSGQVAGLQNTVNTNQANTAAALRAISDASALAANAAQVAATGAAAAVLAAQAEAALRTAGQGALATEAAGFATQARTAATTATTLQTTITTLQAGIATRGGATADEQARLRQHNLDLAAARNALNAAILALNAFLARPAVMNVAGVPRTSLQTVGPPAISSASVPL